MSDDLVRRQTVFSTRLRWIVLLAVLARLGLTLWVAGERQRYFNTDSYQFDCIARNLLAGQPFSIMDKEPRTPDALRTPLYPLLVTAGYALTSSWPVVSLLLNILCAALTVVLTARLARRLGDRAALGAAFVVAVDPASVLYANLVVAEALFTLLLVAIALSLGRLVAAGGTRAAVLTGLLAGLATLAKPAAAYLLIWLTPFALAALVRRTGWRPALKGWCVVLLVGLLAISPWVARNAVVHGFYHVTAIQEVNLLLWNVAVLEGRVQHIGFREAQVRLEAEALDGRSRAELPVNVWRSRFRTKAIERIAASPLTYLWVHLRGSVTTLVDPGRLDLARILGGIEWHMSLLDTLTRQGFVAAVRALLGLPAALLVPLAANGLWILLLLLAALRGVLFGVRRRVPEVLLALVFAGYLVLIVGPIGSARFRVPAVPFLAVLAAAGLCRQGSRGGTCEPC